MVRTQLQLTDHQADRVRRYAQRHGLSMAEVFRQLVDDHLPATDEDVHARAVAVLGRHRSGGGSGSVDHDTALVEAYRR